MAVYSRRELYAQPANGTLERTTGVGKREIKLASESSQRTVASIGDNKTSITNEHALLVYVLASPCRSAVEMKPQKPSSYAKQVTEARKRMKEQQK